VAATNTHVPPEALEFAVTPTQDRRVAHVTLAALTLIVIKGAAVRLTDSGLGCPGWPKCGGTPLPPLSSYALIEFGNRAASRIVGIITVAAAVLTVLWSVAVAGRLAPRAVGVLADGRAGGTEPRGLELVGG
jgi:heme A synthase